MNMDEKNLSFRMLILITNPKPAERAAEMFRIGAVPTHYRLMARGTASSEMMDILGLGSSDRVMLVSMMPTRFANAMLHKLKKELKLGAVNHGIAFCIPVSGANNLILRMLQQLDGEEPPERKDEPAMTEMEYAMIAVVVNQGFIDEVASVARAAGARGGTVLHGRRAGDEQAMNFWGLSVHDEKEVVLIVTDAASKRKIMQAIGEKCGMRSEAKGIVASLPVESVIGLGDDE